MELSLPVVLILDLLLACIAGLEDRGFSDSNYDFSTDFPTTYIDSINTTLEDEDNPSTATPAFESVSESNQTDADDELQLGIIEESDVDSCGSPPVIERARILGKHSPPYVVGTSLSYSCQFGYSADKPRHTSTCIQSSADSKPTWTDSQILCNPQACGDPGYVENAERIGSQFTFPNSVTFECEDGYKLRGPRIRYCQVNGRWTATLPSCEKLTCKTPEKPENGEVLFSSLDYGSRLRYKCDQGFILKNHDTRTCSENGTWSGTEPLCSEVKCDIPVAPEHGRVEMVAKIPRTDTIAFFSCQEGRTLVGSSITKCLDTGQWTFPTPKCLEPCSIPFVSFGTIGKYVERWRRQKQFVTLKPGTAIQDKDELFLRCNEHYEPFGKNKAEEKVSCEKGDWKEPPVCKAAECRDDPPPTENARIATVNKEHGGYVVYYCKKNFKKIKFGKMTCHFGVWTGNTPICADKRCYVDKMGFPGLSKDRNVYRNREVFKPSCVDGYEDATPQNTFICDNGEWKGNYPPCKAASCSEPPPSIEHGRIKAYKELHSSFVEYECEESYLLTSSRVQCLFGKWKGIPPICKTTSCYFQDLKLKEGILLPSKNLTKSGKELDVQCASGYHKLYIQPFCSKGEWIEAEISPCKERSCSVPVVQNGALTDLTQKKIRTWRGNIFELRYDPVKIGAESGPGRFHFITCTEGFTFQGKYLSDVKTTCTKGKWKPTPVCLIPGSIYEEPEEITVAPRISIVKGSVDIISSTTPTTVVHEPPELVEDCYCDYAGSQDLVAYADNQLLEPRSKVKKNSTVKFYCKNFGQDRLIGDKELMCVHCKPWDISEYPNCVPPSTGDVIILFDKEKFNILPGGLLMVNQGLRVSLWCFGKDVKRYPTWTHPSQHEGITLLSSKDNNNDVYYGSIEIHNTSAKHNGEYKCSIDQHGTTFLQLKVIERCKTFAESDDFTIDYDNRQNVNSSVFFTCRDEKKKLEGPGILTCLKNGQWSGKAPRCIFSGCQELKANESMKIEYSDGLQPGSRATFHCPTHYKRKGASFLDCSSNGEWSGNVPTCIPSGCQELNSSEIMKIEYSDGLIHTRSKAIFHCLTPYKREGVSSLECLPNGEWSGNLPTCILPMCSLESLYPDLPETVTANLKEETENNLPYKFEINLICEGNMMLSAPASAQCGIDGKWKIPETKCVPGCPPVQMLAESQVIIEPEKEFYRFGEHVVLSCSPGQQLSNELQVLMCLRTGWSESELPSCESSKQ